jgi:hypothetical protein
VVLLSCFCRGSPQEICRGESPADTPAAPVVLPIVVLFLMLLLDNTITAVRVQEEIEESFK